MEVSGQIRPGRFTLREGTTGTHWIGGWVGCVPPLPQYAFVAWCSVKRKHTGITLPLPRTDPVYFLGILKQSGLYV